jgi:hypothetical protein
MSFPILGKYGNVGDDARNQLWTERDPPHARFDQGDYGCGARHDLFDHIEVFYNSEASALESGWDQPR